MTTILSVNCFGSLWPWQFYKNFIYSWLNCSWTVFFFSVIVNKKKILFCITNHPYSPSKSIYFFPTIYMTSLMQNICPILLVLLWHPRKAKIFSPYNHAISQRVQKAFLFSVPVTESHNKNCCCDKALHMKPEISFESGQCLAVSDCRVQRTEHTSGTSAWTRGKDRYFWKGFSVFSVPSPFNYSLLRKRYFISCFTFVSIYGALALFFWIYKDHSIQLKNVGMTEVNPLTVSTSIKNY